MSLLSASLAIEPRGDIECLTGVQRLGRHVSQRIRSDQALQPEPGRLVANLLVDQEHGDAQGSGHDQADGQQVELGEQPHAYRGGVERRYRVAAER